MLTQLKRLAETMFGYDAVAVEKDRRRITTQTLGTEEDELKSHERRILQAQARDVVRNFSVASWAIRKHLDFVSRFRFDAQAGEEFKGLDETLEGLMAEWSQADNCDVSKRHSLRRWLRIFEARAFVDGDVLAVKLRDGRLQAIEADRLRRKEGRDPEEDRQGVVCNQQGAALAYAVHRRNRGTFEFERDVPADNAIHHGYFDRFDQVRGISPTASGLNALQDVYENFDYALAKAKISQLFGIAFYRDAAASAGIVSEDDDGDDDEDADSEAEPKYKVDFGRGPVSLELEPGDRAEILESKTPSSEFQAFTAAVLQVALKSADIPYCFYDESHTNFYGSRAAVTLYIESCDAKRDALRNVLRNITLWKFRQWVATGRLILPAGMRPENIPYDWFHAGLPWWDPAKEVRADKEAISGLLRCHREIRKERYGDDWFKVVDMLAEEYQYAAKRGVPAEAMMKLIDQNQDPADEAQRNSSK